MEVISNREIKIDNETFLTAIFGDEIEKAHVASFADDPSNITDDRRAACWAGGPATAKTLKGMDPEHNQYFTISLFHRPSKRAPSRRRRQDFDACFLVVADDVREKLPVGNVERLPPPSYKLVTSPGSEQWGWILDNACESRDQVENLLDGLVSQGLAPDGKDPGMKGVTRYVRLPGGSNTKQKKFVKGRPFKCYLVEWEPSRVYAIDELAEVFGINIHAAREAGNVGAMATTHPLYKSHPIFNHVRITGAGNDGFLRIESCLNAAEHRHDPSGAAIKLTDAGVLFYKCHHGHCVDEITGPKALALLDEQLGAQGDFIASVGQWKAEFEAYNSTALRKTLEAKKPGGSLEEPEEPRGFDMSRYVFVSRYNQFYDLQGGMLISKDALNGTYLRWHTGTKNSPLAANLFLKGADKSTRFAHDLGWWPHSIDAPKWSEPIYEDEGAALVNTWRGFALTPDHEGDVSPWLELAGYLVPDEQEREVLLDYLASIVQRPAEKPGFCVLHRGAHRIGKDLLYKGLVMAMGARAAKEATTEQITQGWGDYVVGAKLLIVPEVNNDQDHKLANQLKTRLAPTGTGRMVVNMKGGKVLHQVDCTALIMMSNYRVPLVIETGNKRFFVISSWIEPREPEFYKRIDTWYRNEQGAAKVLGYLLSRDISEFNHSVLPYETSGFKEIVPLSRADYVQTLEELIEDREPPFNYSIIKGKELKTAVKEYAIKGAHKNIVATLEGFGWTKFEKKYVKRDGKSVKLPVYFSRKLPPGSTGAEIERAYLTRAEESQEEE